MSTPQDQNDLLRQLISLGAQGKKRSEIAETLGISVAKVDYLRQKIKKKKLDAPELHSKPTSSGTGINSNPSRNRSTKSSPSNTTAFEKETEVSQDDGASPENKGSYAEDEYEEDFDSDRGLENSPFHYRMEAMDQSDRFRFFGVPVIWLAGIVSIIVVLVISSGFIKEKFFPAPAPLAVDKSPSFTAAGPNRWTFTKANAGKQNLLIFKQPFPSPTSNREICTTFVVVSNAPVYLTASLGRYDTKRPYEGATIKQKLTPGQAWSGVLKHRFRENHSDLKLQFAIVDCPEASCTLEIQGVSISECQED